MRLHIIHLLALLTVTSLHAEPSRQEVEQKFSELDKNSDHLLSPDEVGAPRIFKMLDRDGDGKITLEEAIAAAPAVAAETARASAAPSAKAPLREAVEQKFRELDKDGDHLLTAEELGAPKIFQMLDRDGDGKVTLEEAVAGAPAVAAAQEAEKRKTAAPGGEAAKTVEQKFQELDKNKDGVVTPDELALPKVFQMLDKDGDGKVTLQEAIAGAPAVKAEAAPAVTVPPELCAVSSAEVGIGRRVDDLAFTDLDQRTLKLSQVAGKNGTVIALLSPTCAVSQQYTKSFTRLAGVLREKGLALAVIDPMAADAEDALREMTKDLPLVAQDRTGTMLAGLQARSTAEVFLLDTTRTLLYRGALDDQFGLTFRKEMPTHQFLLEAVTEMLAARKVTVAATVAPGTPLVAPALAEKPATAVTYHHDVQRILQQNCAECHHAGGVGPFSLEDVAEVKDRAKTIRRVVEQGIMPPWFALPAEAGHASPWANDRSLAPADRRALLAWLDSKDRPLGSAGDAPKPVQWPQGWTLGQPDAVLTFAKPIDIKAEGTMPYVDVVVPTNFSEDRWVSAVEVLPGARQVVHHVVVTIAGKGKMQRDGGGGEGSTGYFALYVPGTSAERSPAGMAKRLPAGAALHCQMHYTPNGTAATDTTRIGLFFTKEAPAWEIRTAAAMNNKIAIPAGAMNHQETASGSLPPNALLLSLFPHMHVRGRAFRYDLVQPDGTSRPLLEVPRYDFNWQLSYQLATPIVAAPGTSFKVTAWYDNSAANRANPDPSKTVRWGLQTAEEMLVGSIRYAVPIKPQEATAGR